MNRFWLLSLFALSTGAHACINDRDSDSLAVQAQKLPDTLRVITGRFERNPPLYYEMRIRRSLAELKNNPRNFGLYDDIGAAFDRLHRSDEALQIMAKKRAVLPRFDAKNASVKETWYRYFANAGTFRAHRWLGDGAKVQSIGQMKVARDFIQRAIEIKPNAHFGREKYQLMTMDWIVAVKTKKTIETLGAWLANKDGWEDTWEMGNGPAPKRVRAVEGLSGLIVLGAAWQSVDIFEALSAALENKDGVALRHLSLLRCVELLKGNGASLVPKTFNTSIANHEMQDSRYAMYAGVAVNKANRKSLNELFPKLRAEADAWSGARTAYMLARIEKGQHPDTDARFWSEWKPAVPPGLEVWVNEKQQKIDAAKWRTRRDGIFAASLLLGPLALVWLLDRYFSRKPRLT